MPDGKFTIAAAQLAPRLGDLAANLALYESTLTEARGRGADLVVFPELSLTGYLLRDMVSTVALRLDSPEIARLRELSRSVAFVAGLVEETPSFRFHNASIFFDRGEIVAVHRKVYLPTYGMFDEQRYFARGDRIRAFDSRFGRAAMLVCEDLWHPSTAYLAALDGALLVLCPSTSPLRGVSEGTEPRRQRALLGDDQPLLRLDVRVHARLCEPRGLRGRRRLLGRLGGPRRRAARRSPRASTTSRISSSPR